MDNNVTRHVAGELEQQDWNLMVLHYLGLDHIGHKSGPRSSHMPSKQREMDAIVQKVFEALESKEHLSSTLLVLCGDHGMNDAGNHGASSPGETSPALVFISPKFKKFSSSLPAPSQPRGEFDYYSKVEQSDIAPTIAALLGFPIPKNNLGAFILDFLPLWPSSRDKVQILIRNAKQILQVVTAALGNELFDPSNSLDPCTLENTEENDLACGWRAVSQRAGSQASAATVDEDWLSATETWIRKAQGLMSGMASNYDIPKLFLGLGLSVAAVLISLVTAGLQGIHHKDQLMPLMLIVVSYGPMMSASSYVEEEHHFWYWASTLWLTYLGAKTLRR